VRTGFFFEEAVRKSGLFYLHQIVLGQHALSKSKELVMQFDQVAKVPLSVLYKKASS
jgi:hypothetical protein